jgi:hypothetical protein
VGGDEEEDEHSESIVAFLFFISSGAIVPKMSDPTSGSHHGCHTYIDFGIAGNGNSNHRFLDANK